MSIADHHSFVVRKAEAAEASLICYLRLASLLCIEMPSHALAAIRTVMGVLPDVGPDLVASGRYFVADLAGELIGGVGWSEHRDPAFVDGLMDERGDPVSLPFDDGTVLLRGFFLDPELGRRGAAARMLGRIEADAAREGFGAAEVFAPATSLTYYRSLGLRQVARYSLRVERRDPLPLVRMRKTLSPRLAVAA